MADPELPLNCPRCGAALLHTHGAKGVVVFDCSEHGFVAMWRNGCLSLVEQGPHSALTSAATPAAPSIRQAVAHEGAPGE